MTKRKKRIARLKQVKGEISIKVVQIVLGDYGYYLDRINGSHFHFRSKHLPPITIPVHKGHVSRVYINLIIECLNI